VLQPVVAVFPQVALTVLTSGASTLPCPPAKEVVAIIENSHFMFANMRMPVKVIKSLAHHKIVMTNNDSFRGNTGKKTLHVDIVSHLFIYSMTLEPKE
jgi:hypothetical protein